MVEILLIEIVMEAEILLIEIVMDGRDLVEKEVTKPLRDKCKQNRRRQRSLFSFFSMSEELPSQFSCSLKRRKLKSLPQDCLSSTLWPILGRSSQELVSLKNTKQHIGEVYFECLCIYPKRRTSTKNLGLAGSFLKVPAVASGCADLETHSR